MIVNIKKRNEKGLHCRFCKDEIYTEHKIDLYETSPVKGIVCGDCTKHLKDYVEIKEIKALPKK